MATNKTIGLGCWVFLCVAGFAPLRAAQEAVEEKYLQDFPALEAQDPEAEEAYHIRNSLVLLMGAGTYTVKAWESLPGVKQELTLLYDLFHNVYGYTVYSTFNL